jgi:hypothetical protein
VFLGGQGGTWRSGLTRPVTGTELSRGADSTTGPSWRAPSSDTDPRAVPEINVDHRSARPGPREPAGRSAACYPDVIAR